MSDTRPRVPRLILGLWGFFLAVIVAVRYVMDVEVGIMNGITLAVLFFLALRSPSCGSFFFPGGRGRSATAREARSSSVGSRSQRSTSSPDSVAT